METKTIKIKQGEYTNFTDEFDKHDVNILTGARGSGKSYPVAKYIKKLLMENENNKFIYMRNRDEELATYAGWCKDLDLVEVINHFSISSPCVSYKLIRGRPVKGEVTLQGYDEDKKLCYERIIAKCISLNSSSLFKSDNYSDYVAIIFEEYSYLNMTTTNEKKYVFNFLENVESVFRTRPKKIFLISNSLKNIPLIETGIDEMTGIDEETGEELYFKNPCKYKIFRQSIKKKSNEFMAYLNGELYDDDDFKVNIDEFHNVYINKEYIIMRHNIFENKYYILGNNDNQKLLYTENSYLNLYAFIRYSINNEFYYQNNYIEKKFVTNYLKIQEEIRHFTAIQGKRYILER